MKSLSTSESVPLVNRIRMNILIQLVYFSPYPFQIKNGNQSLWTLLQGLPKAQGKDCIYVVVDRLTTFALLCNFSYLYNSTGSRFVF